MDFLSSPSQDSRELREGVRFHALDQVELLVSAYFLKFGVFSPRIVRNLGNEMPISYECEHINEGNGGIKDIPCRFPPSHP